ncbi:hypothetical protein HYPSUDRAFT_65961 [Hypholoma sublateritium FD-334 SS-4]|uniref:Cation/H+ exchanger transmembrane domain-containing protein n=1 Tax=Hypholoma sublateritium (strain FD-334 SS-4) TaxID=945553 RepID=A0A0D2MJI4_HYPSF|nr:hypothetical protein HYPSUDRAFT_65961 [Hypholoma sublateritium FD-334 SS-4]
MSASDVLADVPLTTTIPTGNQVPYTPPSIPALLSLSAFLVLLALPTLLSNSYPVFASQPKISPEGDTSNVASSSNPSTKPQVYSYNLDASLTIIVPLLLGTLFGPSITSNAILSTSTQCTLINIGYIGLILLIFEAGVSLDPASLKLMRDNAALSTLVALTGALVPIALSMGLGMSAYGYGGLQAFASGASLASTSLGTTLALLAPTSTASVTSEIEKERTPDMDLRRTRVGCVLVCAALLDDILGLVIAGIIPGLAQTGTGDSSNVQWPVIVRPILVSVAFGLGTPLAAMGLRWVIHRFISKSTPRPQFLLLFIILVLTAFVAGSGYAGTSELFGAYLAGAFVSHVFPAQDDAVTFPDDSVDRMSSPDMLQDGNVAVKDVDGGGNPSHAAFGAYIQPVLTHLFAPLFFGSIGVALPIKEMFTTHPDAVQIAVTVQAGLVNTTTIIVDSGRTSHQVIWRGLIYSLLMILSKMVVGFWMLVWPEPNVSRARTGTQRSAKPPSSASAPSDIESARRRPTFSQRFLRRMRNKLGGEPATHKPPASNPSTSVATRSQEPTRVRAALLLGLAMVARGEIALIVAELARPLLVGPALPSAMSTAGAGAGNTTVTRRPIPDEEPFAIVVWAILLSTVGGAIGVGALTTSWKKKTK